MKIKKGLTLLLVTAIILSSLNVLYANTNAAPFTDINSSWAKQHIINVYNKDLMSGKSATEFKPLDKITNYEVLVSIARMTKAKDNYDLIALESKYKESVLDKYNVPLYAREAVAYCLETGIVSAEDISALTSKTLATKQVVSAYIAKAFGVTYDPAKPIVFLGYSDAMFITKENKVYIKYLIDLGVLSSEGDGKGNFNPDAQIDRATYAKMLDIASDKYKEIFPTTSTPTPTPTPTEPETPTTPTPTTPAEQPDLIGKVDKVIIEYGTIVFDIQGANNTVTKKSLLVADNIKCIIDDKEISYYWNIKPGDKAQIFLNNDGKISKLIVDSKVKKVSGTIESILVTDKLELNINVENKGLLKYYLTDATKIIKNKNTVKYDSLKAGDNVHMTVSNDEVLEINADSTISTDNGIIESIIYTRTAAPKITMIGLDGQNKEYFIRKDLAPQNIIIDGRNSYVYDLRPGMHVMVDLENDEIIKLTTIRVQTNDKLDGVIKYVNKSFKLIVLSQYGIDGKEITKEISVEDCEIRNVYLEELTLDDLKEGDRVTVFAVEDAGKLKASLIILIN